MRTAHGIVVVPEDESRLDSFGEAHGTFHVDVRPRVVRAIQGGEVRHGCHLRRHTGVDLEGPLHAAAEEDFTGQGIAAAVHHLDPDERIAAHPAQHRLLGNHDASTWRDGDDLDRGFSGIGVCSLDIVAEDQVNAQPPQLGRAIERDLWPRRVFASEEVHGRLHLNGHGKRLRDLFLRPRRHQAGQTCHRTNHQGPPQ
jgi:hypothetical protein